MRGGASEPRLARPRAAGFFRWFFIALGAFFAFLALIVYPSQGSQITVTAKVISEHCHSNIDVTDPNDRTRCDVEVLFDTKEGKVVRTSVGDAYPDEVVGPLGMRTIQLRYDSGDPAQPYKQSNVMPFGFFLSLLIGGIGLAAGSLFLFRRRLPPDYDEPRSRTVLAGFRQKGARLARPYLASNEHIEAVFGAGPGRSIDRLVVVTDQCIRLFRVSPFGLFNLRPLETLPRTTRFGEPSGLYYRCPALGPNEAVAYRFFPDLIAADTLQDGRDAGNA